MFLCEGFINAEGIIISMQESTLLKIALAVSLVGIVVLFVLLQSVSVDEAMIGRLDGMVDESVVVGGVVLDVTSFEGTTFLRIQKEEMMSVVLFGNVPLVEIGDYVQVRGKVAEHEGEVEVIGEEVRVV
jgi:DNA/RNA endonuclease YhcR with UshA esterase domain